MNKNTDNAILNGKRERERERERERQKKRVEATTEVHPWFPHLEPIRAEFTQLWGVGLMARSTWEGQYCGTLLGLAMHK